MGEKTMGRTCKGICLALRAGPVPNRLRYEMGHKRCTFCGLYLVIADPRCPCCRAVLRTKPRGKK